MKLVPHTLYLKIEINFHRDIMVIMSMQNNKSHSPSEFMAESQKKVFHLFDASYSSNGWRGTFLKHSSSDFVTGSQLAKPDKDPMLCISYCPISVRGLLPSSSRPCVSLCFPFSPLLLWGTHAHLSPAANQPPQLQLIHSSASAGG